MTHAEKQEWLAEQKVRGARPVMMGLAEIPLEEGEELTLADAPQWTTAPEESFLGIGGLIGGMFSGDGSGPSFRGKAYAGFVERVTGFSLYQEEIHTDEVTLIAERLRAFSDWLHADPKRMQMEMREGYSYLPETTFMQAVAGGLLHGSTDDPWGYVSCSVDEAENLAKWFEVCATQGYMVNGWA